MCVTTAYKSTESPAPVDPLKRVIAFILRFCITCVLSQRLLRGQVVDQWEAAKEARHRPAWPSKSGSIRRRDARKRSTGGWAADMLIGMVKMISRPLLHDRQPDHVDDIGNEHLP